MAINSGEKFRKKLVVVLQKFGTEIAVHREAYIDLGGTSHPATTKKVHVLDLDDASRRFTDIVSFFNIALSNSSNPGIADLIYAAEAGTLGPEASFRKALIDEGDELHFGGWAYEVTRQKPLPISGVNCFRHCTCTRLRPL